MSRNSQISEVQVQKYLKFYYNEPECGPGIDTSQNLQCEFLLVKIELWI